VIQSETPVNNFTAVQLSAIVANQYPGNFAYAVITCAPANQFADVKTVKTTEHSVKPGAFSRGISTCPSGMYAFGGGGYFSSSGSDIIGKGSTNYSNTPSADGRAWTFSGKAPPDSNSLVTVTQCAPKVGRDFLMQAGVPSNNYSIVSVYADCPAGYTAISGGFYASNPDGSEAVGHTSFWTVPASNSGFSSWFASGYAPPNSKLVSLAQCIF
jgi:hypothetical protein